LLDFSAALDYPPYLGRPNETVANSGDLTVPAGTRITWTMNARSADRMDLVFDDTTLVLPPSAKSPGGGVFTATRRFLQSRAYHMAPYHGERAADTPPRHRVEVVADLHPVIQVETRVDSTAPKRLF